MGQSKKFVLIVQGEGRGHITQCISMRDALVHRGHQVLRVIIGKIPHRKLPAFVYEKLNCPISTIQSPTFIMDKNKKGIRIVSSVFYNVLHSGKLRQSTKQLKNLLQNDQPDAIINFYDPLLSLLYFFKKPPFCIISVAHQNIFQHPEYKYPKGRLFDRIGLKLFTQFNARHAQLRIALSLYPLKSFGKKNISITPPLLRKEVFEQSISQQDFILVYLVNQGYLEDIQSYCMANPKVIIHCFCDRNTELSEELLAPNLTWHRINDKLFLNKLASCKALVSTAGFETVAECMYFGKRALVVPVAGHYEQFCNAHDAHYAKVAIHSTSFEIDKLLDFAKENIQPKEEIQEWIEGAAIEITTKIEDQIKTYQNARQQPS